MKKLMLFILSVVMVFSLCACGGGTNNTSTEKEETPIVEEKPQKPTIESVVEGIKNDFKDPDSVQVSDGSWARVKNGDEESETEFYIICTVRAKNSMGGYGEPQAYIIHCNNGNYRIVEEYNDESFYTQKKFNELGCGNSMMLH